MKIATELNFNFYPLVQKYIDGSHGITKNDLDGNSVDHYYCAIRRALRDVSRSDIVQDIDIRLCIKWGLSSESLPTQWKRLPKNWTR